MKNSILRLSLSGLLIAVGIVIPMFSPLKIVLEPASFTLASHVAIFIAMFISPQMALAVAVGTTVGLFFGAFPLVIVFRAASHMIFATVGALFLHKKHKTINSINSIVKLRIFSFVISFVHALGELIVVSFFYFGGNMSGVYYQHGFLVAVLLLVGLGTVIHSMIDFEIAHILYFVLQKQKGFKRL